MAGLFYLKKLREKGIERKGKIEFIEKNKKDKKVYYEELTELENKKLEEIIENIKYLLSKEEPPIVSFENKCKKCSYYEYCYI